MPNRSATLSRIVLKSQRKAIVARWENISEFNHNSRIRQYDKTSRKSKPFIFEAKATDQLGTFLSRIIGKRQTSENFLGSASRTFTTTRRNSCSSSRRVGEKFDVNVDNGSVLPLLKDKDAYPIGSIAKIKEEEKSIEYWVSASGSIPRRRKGRHNGYGDKYSQSYTKCFENAKSILSRLALEQKIPHDDNVTTSPDLSFVTASTEQMKGSLKDNGDVICNRLHKKRQEENEANEIFSDNFYVVRSFLLNRVVDCWRIGWRDGLLDFKPNELIAWVEEMDNTRSDSMISDSRTWTMIVDSMISDSRTDPYEAPLLAQWLLDQRLGQAHENKDNAFLRPDTVFFTNVIRSWAKSGRVEAPEMADGLLQMMHELYLNDGWTESAPNAYSYAATMEAWSKSHNRQESITRIAALLEEMKNSNLVQVVPDRLSYQYVLNAWANLRSPTGAKKAYDILQEMIALYEAGNVLVAPNASNFSRVMIALAYNGDKNRVESVLSQLHHLYAKTGDRNFQPTMECLKACIVAKSHMGEVAEAQKVLDELVERAISEGNTYLMPRRRYFIDTLVAWTKIKDQTKAAENSQKVLDLMTDLARRDESYCNLRPDAKTFDKVILAWSRSRHQFAPERIGSLLREMERESALGNQKMKPSLAGFTNLLLAWQRSGRDESVDMIQKIFDSLQIRCSKNSEKHLRPDNYVFGILIDAWSSRKDLDKVDYIFQEMINEWKNGNSDARPDVHIFHRILNAHSKGYEDRTKAVMKCEHYFSLMKKVGLPTTIQASGYLIAALSLNSNSGTSNIDRATAVLDELLESVRKGNSPFPPKQREYQQFLRTISKSSIPRRNQQAKKALMSLSRVRGPVPKELLPA